MKKLYSFCRYFVAFVACSYGFAKLFGAQFTVLDSELDKPMGEVSGFWLTWYYFGYSAFYGNLIGIVQIVSGMMLTFRKTTLLGACILLVLLINIALIDIAYGVQGVLLIVFILVAAVLFILSQHSRELIQTFFTIQNTFLPDKGNTKKWLIFVKYFIRVSILGITGWFMYYTANYNNRLPTILDGRWQLAKTSDSAITLPERIYFEHNRAWMAVFKYSDHLETNHFETVPAKDSIYMYDEWMTKSRLIFAGKYALKDSSLQLTGQWQQKPVIIQFLKKKRIG